MLWITRKTGETIELLINGVPVTLHCEAKSSSYVKVGIQGDKKKIIVNRPESKYRAAQEKKDKLRKI